MYVYLVPLYLFFVFLFFEKIKNKKRLIFLGVVPIFLSLVFQEAIGTDYYNYIRIFHEKIPFEYSRGPIFKIMIIILKKICNHERIMFISVAFIQSLLLYKIILKLYEMKIIKRISLFILIVVLSSGIYLQMFNVLRSSVASLFINLAVLNILENKNGKSFFLILFGSGFHPSVFIWNGIYIIKNILYKKIKIIIMIILIISCYVLNKINFIQNIARIIYELEITFPYRHHLVSKHMFPYIKTFGIATVINMIFFILCLKFYNKENNDKKIFFYNLGYIFFSLRLFFANIPIFNRLLEPSGFFQAFIIYQLILKTLNKKYFYFGIVILLYYVVYFIRSSLLMLPAT